MHGSPQTASDSPASREQANGCVIIGGGPAGLTAAYELAKLGRHSLVLEQDDLVGGISRTVEYKGYRFDIGGHRFFTKVPYVQEVWKDLLEKEFLTRPRLSRIFYKGHFFDYPLRPFGALRGLGPIESARVIASYAKSTVFPYRPERNFAEWVSNRFGKRLFEIFFESYTEKVWGIPCTEISADWAAQRIKNLDLVSLIRDALLRGRPKKGPQITSLIEEFEYPRHGPGQMWEACVERLASQGVETRMRTRVRALQHDGQRVRAVVTEDQDGIREIEGDDFLSSMPVRTLLRCLQPAPPDEILAAADSLRYRDFLTVGLIVDRPELFPDNWIYVHSPEVKLGRIQNFKNWSPHMVPDQSMTALGLEYFVQEGDEIWDAEDEDLIALGTRECTHLGLIPEGSVRDGVVIRMPKAYPVYDDTYQEALRVVRGWLDRLTNLQLIGRNGQHRYNNQDHSMVTAVYAARNIAAGKADYDVWNVNVEEEYHETTSSGEGEGDATQERPKSGATGERLVPGRIAAPDLDETARAAFARYHPVALGVAVGAVGATLVLVATAVLLVQGGPNVGARLSLLANYLPAYRVSWVGGLIGAAEAAVGGFVFGWVLAKLINGLVRIEERSLLRQIEARVVDPLEGEE
ncbi:MAG: NAD(P)/FAD-dependent oxidoreductase [Planctomycetota bacterium]